MNGWMDKDIVTSNDDKVVSKVHLLCSQYIYTWPRQVIGITACASERPFVIHYFRLRG